MKTWVRIIFQYGLPIGCCILKLYQLISAYYEYGSVTEITQRSEDNMDIPIIVFCVKSLLSFQNCKPEKLNKSDYPTPKSRLDRFIGLNNETVSYFRNDFSYEEHYE